MGGDGLQQTVTRQHLGSQDRGTPKRLRESKEASNPVQKRDGGAEGFLEEVTPESSLKAQWWGDGGWVWQPKEETSGQGSVPETMKWTESSSKGDSEPLGLLEKPRVPGSNSGSPPDGVRDRSPGSVTPSVTLGRLLSSPAHSEMRNSDSLDSRA